MQKEVISGAASGNRRPQADINQLESAILRMQRDQKQTIPTPTVVRTAYRTEGSNKSNRDQYWRMNSELTIWVDT